MRLGHLAGSRNSGRSFRLSQHAGPTLGRSLRNYTTLLLLGIRGSWGRRCFSGRRGSPRIVGSCGVSLAGRIVPSTDWTVHVWRRAVPGSGRRRSGHSRSSAASGTCAVDGRASSTSSFASGSSATIRSSAAPTSHAFSSTSTATSRSASGSVVVLSAIFSSLWTGLFACLLLYIGKA